MEQQMNSGMPPAGEAGMLLYQSTTIRTKLDFKYSRGDGGFGYGEDSAKLAFASANGYGEVPCLIWRWATFAEVSAEVGPEEARKMVHRSQLPDAPWYPPQQDGFGPWIEGAPPAGSRGHGQILCDFERMKRNFRAVHVYLESETTAADIVAYCVSLEDKPLRGVNPGTWSDCGGSYDPNAEMIERDNVQPQYMGDGTKDERPVPVRNPLLICAPWTNRFGGWGA